MSELKSISGSSRLPYGTLALGAEGIKDAIKTFDDACVPLIILLTGQKTDNAMIHENLEPCRRKSDIENERLPPVEERQSTSSTIPGASASPGPNIPGASTNPGPTSSRTNTVGGAGFKRPKDGKVTSAKRR